MSSKKLKVYLADLIHNRHIYNYSVPLNIGYITAMLNKRLGMSVETRMFKFPDDLISAMKTSPPDVLALSNYDWNVNLNRALIKIGKKINSQLFVVMGGPNIRKKPEGVKEFLLNHTTDMHVVNEGEEAFSNIIEYILGFWPCNIKQVIGSSGIKFENAAYLENETQNLMLGKKPVSAHEKNIPFPSPYLTGLMEPFMNNTAFPLQPLIETNRNCPYQCHFCVWGDFDLTKIRVFDYDTVIEELRYIVKNSKHHFTLTIADANFGILNRDLQIAEEIRRLSDKYKVVDRVFIAQAKNSPRRNLEISKILGKICIPDFAVQTLTPGILEHSGRRNLSNDQVKQMVDGIKENGHEVMTDILMGLPGETKEQFIDSMKNVVNFGFHRAQVGDIRLLDGSVMAEDDFRKKYGLLSRFRVIPSAYGEYGGEKVIEYEECIRTTNTMSSKDFLELRLFNAHYFLLYYLALGRPLLDFAQKKGIHPISLIADISKNIDKKNYPTLTQYIEKFIKTANEEWYGSVEEADKYYLQPKIFNKLMKDGFPKLNYEYASELIQNFDLRREFMEWLSANIINKLPEQKTIVDEITKFCIERVYSLPIETKKNTMELSLTSAGHIAAYYNDYNYSNLGDKEKKTYRQGEYRDAFTSIGSLVDEKENVESLKNNLNNNSKIEVLFDTDNEKTDWLIKQIKRNGGEKNLMLAIQVLLQENQRSFLRSWKIA